MQPKHNEKSQDSRDNGPSALSRRGKLYLLFTCGLSVFSSLSFTLSIYYMAEILQRAQKGSLPGLLQMTGLSVAFLAIWFVMAIASKWTRLQYISDGTLRMRGNIMRAIFNRPISLFRRQSDAYFLNLLGADTDMYAAERLNMIPAIFSGAAQIVMFIGALWLINPWLMAACIVLSLLPLFTGNLFTKAIQQRKEAYSNASETFTGALKEGIEGYKPIRMGHGTAAYMDRFLAACQNKQRAYSASSMINAVSMQTLYLMGCFLNAACTAVGGYLVLRGVLSPAMLLAAVGYSGNLSNAFSNIAEYVITIRSTQRIARKLRSESRAETKPTALDLTGEKQEVVYETVSFGFGERQLYDGFSQHFRENGCYAVIGESGSGKSTLMKLLLKYYDHYTGVIKLSGHDIRELSEDEIFEVVGVVDQSPFLFNASLYENIMLFGHDMAEDSEAYRKLLEDVNLTALAQRVGDAPLGDFGDNISGGERQRISLARTMRRHPRIILFDEPTTGLDPENAALINRFIFDHADMLRIVIGHNWNRDYLNRFDGVIRIGC